MSREIKFRGKKDDNDEWCYGNLIQMDSNSFQVFIVPFFELASTLSCSQIVARDMMAVDRKTISQYTGLHDKNGKEIYEGDIVKQNFDVFHEETHYSGFYSISGYDIGEVAIYASKGVCMKSYIRNAIENEQNVINKKVKHFKNVTGSRCEVIGNIYENPDLLKGGD